MWRWRGKWRRKISAKREHNNAVVYRNHGSNAEDRMFEKSWVMICIRMDVIFQKEGAVR